MNKFEEARKYFLNPRQNNCLTILPKTWRDSGGWLVSESVVSTPIRKLAVHWYSFGSDLLALVILNPNIVGSVGFTYSCTFPLSGVFRISLVWTTGLLVPLLLITFISRLLSSIFSKKHLTFNGAISPFCGVYLHLKSAGPELFAQTLLSLINWSANRWESEESKTRRQLQNRTLQKGNNGKQFFRCH